MASVSVGDIDGDNKPEMVISNAGDSTVSVFLNSSTIGAISFAAPMTFISGFGISGVAISDINSDGKADLAIVSQYSNVSVLRNTSFASTISFAAPVIFATGNSPINMSISDVDGDSKPDLAIVNQDNTISVLLNSPVSDSVAFLSQSFFETGNYPSSIAIADIYGDGKPDIAVTNEMDNTVSVFKNDPLISLPVLGVKTLCTGLTKRLS